MIKEVVLPGGTKFLADVDPALTAEVAFVRRGLSIPMINHDVIVDPMFAGYVPHIYTNGTVHLANEGVDDFQKKIGDRPSLQGLDVNRLLAVYAVVNHGLTRRKDQDAAFDRRVTDTAVKLKRSLTTELSNSVKIAKGLVIGRAAVLCAIARAELVMPADPNRPSISSLLKGALTPIKDDGGRYKFGQERHPLVHHFRLRLSLDENEQIRQLLYPA